MLAQVTAYRPDQATPLVVDKWRSDTLLIKLKTGEFYTGFFQYWDDGGPCAWKLNNRDADEVEPQDIEWWVSAPELSQCIKVENDHN